MTYSLPVSNRIIIGICLLLAGASTEEPNPITTIRLQSVIWYIGIQFNVLRWKIDVNQVNWVYFDV